MSKRKFTWNAWDFDFEGEAYIIAKSECPERLDVPKYIASEDKLHVDCAPEMEIEEGWCKFQIRSDWENYEGAHGWYVVTQIQNEAKRLDGKCKPGWFTVWIVRKGEWY